MSVTFTMLVGLPSSGKSTFAEKLQRIYGNGTTETVIVSSDSYREKNYGKEEIQGNNNKLFEEIHNDILKYLSEGKNVIFDATNLIRKFRVSIVQRLPKEVIKECIVIATSYGRCLERNNLRERKVPVNVIDRMWKSFQIPSFTEGFDMIDFEYDYDESAYDIEEYLNFADLYDQQNPHHTMTLGRHSRCVAEILKENKADSHVVLAGLLHDNAKPMTQTFTNMKGEPSEFAHYYFHEGCSAYEAMFYLDSKIVKINLVTIGSF